MNNKAFSIAELIVVIAIVLILSAAAINGMTGIIKSLRFSNTYNKIIFMVQQARSLAISGKGAVATYGVTLNLTSGTVQSFSEGTSTPAVTMETLTLSPTSKLTLCASNQTSGTTNCASTASIRFEQSTGAATFACDTNQTLSLMKVTLQENSTNCSASSVPRKKSFLIHKAAGVPQAE